MMRHDGQSSSYSVLVLILYRQVAILEQGQLHTVTELNLDERLLVDLHIGYMEGAPETLDILQKVSTVGKWDNQE